MNEYVYANSDGMVLNEVRGGTVFLVRGEPWWADDPFVLARPELFSETPLMVRGTIGQMQPKPTPIGARSSGTAEPKKRSEPYYAKARRA